MSSTTRSCLLFTGLLCSISFVESAPAADATHEPLPPRISAFTPDAASVVRSGPAYRYSRSGWIVLHIEGTPYERGYQHGQLMAREIVDYIASLAEIKSQKAPEDAWRDMRTLVNAVFLRRYDAEYLEEMKGIADGAAAAGAKFHSRKLDLVDVVAVNSAIEVEFLSSGLDATATGLEGMKFREPPDVQATQEWDEHCSAFAAVGPATADGGIVFGHITMFRLPYVRHFNVWLDIAPSDGHRVIMQSYPGGIMSGLDYYMNDAGLLVAETTIRQTTFDISGLTVASRIRRALQYADNIDRAVEILNDSNNGLFTNEWLLADINTNEIAMFELGTRQSKLWRSGKDEWPGGTKGFYWGCNNAKEL
ncbi:MAG TPA: C45 family autoproteolytic acyltransferase/hydrolase, partial [Pirellulales bacterium]|nr:C45 family autoproteolytic acyltransferase/hydrolase [Pirellulales bacterium]